MSCTGFELLSKSVFTVISSVLSLLYFLCRLRFDLERKKWLWMTNFSVSHSTDINKLLCKINKLLCKKKKVSSQYFIITVYHHSVLSQTGDPWTPRVLRSPVWEPLHYNTLLLILVLLLLVFVLHVPAAINYVSFLSSLFIFHNFKKVKPTGKPLPELTISF